MGRALLLATAAVLLAQGVRGWKEWTWEGDGPGPRAGHSMVLINETAFLFGGRANDIAVPHVPKTYEVSEENGQLSFTTYDQNLVLACDGNRTFDECYNISIGLLFNDLWSYDLGEWPRAARPALGRHVVAAGCGRGQWSAGRRPSRLQRGARRRPSRLQRGARRRPSRLPRGASPTCPRSARCSVAPSAARRLHPLR